MRNRIIAGMAIGVVIVEGKQYSGSLITARLAIKFGREVFGVPGKRDAGCELGAEPVNQARSETGNQRGSRD